MEQIMSAHPRSLPAVNRRLALRQLAAGTALASAGCSLVEGEPPSDAGPTGNTETPAETAVENTQRPKTWPYRLFTVVLKTSEGPNAYFSAQGHFEEFSSEIVESGGVANVFEAVDSPDGKRTFQFVAWMKPAMATDFEKSPHIAGVHPLKPGEPTASGVPPLRAGLSEEPGNGRRQVIVALGPNSWRTSVEAQAALRSFQTNEEIAKQWSQQLRNVAGVKVQAVESAKWTDINAAGIHIGATPGQIQVSFPGESVPDEVLKVLQAHPQTWRLRWDHPDVIYNCPPCGRG